MDRAVFGMQVQALRKSAFLVSKLTSKKVRLAFCNSEKYCVLLELSSI